MCSVSSLPKDGEAPGPQGPEEFPVLMPGLFVGGRR